jgi:hypothetical protein
VVILASAIAALVQLRHMRGSNQIVALTECRETMESAEFGDALAFVSYELPKRLSDPAEVGRLLAIPFVDEYRAIGTVGNFFESMGVFVKNGIIDKDIACDVWSGVVLRNWEALAPIVEFLRGRTSEALWENFEYLAVLASQFLVEHPSSYPLGFPRMPKDRTLVESRAESSTP